MGVKSSKPKTKSRRAELLSDVVEAARPPASSDTSGKFLEQQQREEKSTAGGEADANTSAVSATVRKEGHSSDPPDYRSALATGEMPDAALDSYKPKADSYVAKETDEKEGGELQGEEQCEEGEVGHLISALATMEYPSDEGKEGEPTLAVRMFRGEGVEMVPGTLTSGGGVVVFDNGTGLVKCGFGGEHSPRCVFPNVVGVEKFVKAPKVLEVAESAFAKRDTVKLLRPMERGVVANWDQMELIWECAFNSELRVDPREYAVSCGECPLSKTQNRKLATELFFEKFNVPLFNVSLLPMWALFGSGKTTGTVVDSGYGVSYAAPIVDGVYQHFAEKRLNLSGKDVNEQLAKQLWFECGAKVDASVLVDIKEKHCCIEYGTDTVHSVDYQLPDGRILELNSAVTTLAGEQLFQPLTVGVDNCGIAQMAFDSVQKCNAVNFRALFGNAVVVGGTTKLRNFAQRFESEVNALIAANVLQPPGEAPIECSANASEERQFSAWSGGSLMSQLPAFNRMWISKSEFAEFGPTVVHRKCF